MKYFFFRGNFRGRELYYIGKSWVSMRSSWYIDAGSFLFP